MSDFGSQIIYKQLLQRHERVRIPMIQRDYAQGRPAEAEVRNEFLAALEGALRRPADDLSLPLNLDFIYGSIEGQHEKRFCPLDGQQRLTTLFLLHWYLAWSDDQWDVFREMFRTHNHSRFSYSVRPSSNEFFDELVTYEPECRPGDVDQLSRLITNQPWYFRSWRLDPTIQSTLVMLDAIHSRFSSANGLFERLTSESKPAITFQLLDLDNFGLSDDLYIKMNARGRPLTPFETFKARYEQELGKQFSGEFRRIDNQEFPIADFVARRMDTKWADLFWAHRVKEGNLYDSAVMNVFRAVALVTRDPESKTYLEDVALLRDGGNPPSYSTFYAQGWLDRDFTETLISLLESWSAADVFSKPLLPDSQYFDEREILERLIQNPTSLTLPEVIQFSGYTLFIREHEQSLDSDAFQEWMRVVRNLVVNSYIERPDQLRSSSLGLHELLSKSKQILEHMSKLTPKDRVTGFSDQQVKEETLKAGLILSHGAWRPLIDRAEGHGYFRGQIEFLLDFCGVITTSIEGGKADWDDDLHISLQGRFEEYLKKAEAMFTNYGLANLGAYRWQRTLLSIGDYLLPSGRQNYSFLVNSSTEQASWKRLLRGTGPKVPEARKLLHQLWDRLTLGMPTGEQLDQIIASATTLEPWREAFVQTPEAIDYCGNQSIRWNASDEVYLLKKSQMNGAHAELFSFCLYQKVLRPLSNQSQLAPLILRDYQSVNGTDFQPHILLAFAHEGQGSSIKVEFKRGIFVILVDCTSLQNRPDIVTILRDSLGFVQVEGRLSKAVSPTVIERSLLDLAQAVAKVSTADSSHA
jgi:hypothetical protein